MCVCRDIWPSSESDAGSKEIWTKLWSAGHPSRRTIDIGVNSDVSRLSTCDLIKGHFKIKCKQGSLSQYSSAQ